MTLEDQIRRVGEARADEVTTPAWREYLGRSRPRGRWIVAAAAVLALVVGGAVLFDGNDSVDTETAEGDRTPSVSTEREPATTTTDRPPTTDPLAQGGICAANAEPGDDVLDVATHIAFDRTPLDLDQDGVDDEMLVYDDADGNWFLVARLQTGWTNALGLGTPPTPPGLAMTSEGVPAGTDLDGDGQLEFFITGYIGPSAAMVTLRGCELVDRFFLDEPAGGSGAGFRVQIGLSADMPLCVGRSCATRVRCVDDVLVQELFVGVAANDAPGEWVSVEGRLDPDGVITTTELPARIVGPFETLDDPPTNATTGVIDCSPQAVSGEQLPSPP
jgi:hypothetical protein